MSQEKVDRYKKEKNNREKTMKKEKIIRNIEYGLTGLVLCAMVVWCGFSIYQKAAEQKASETTVYEVNTEAMDSYAQNVRSAAKADTSSATEEASSASETEETSAAPEAGETSTASETQE